jgi:Virulence-associated protein E
MPSVTLTLIDTPTGGVAIQTDFAPAIGNPCSPAQSTALEIIARTKKQWGVIGQVVTPPTAKNFEGAVIGYQFKEGVALVLSGPQGSGKSTLACKLATRYGSFEQTDMTTFRFHHRDFLCNGQKTLIVDGIPNNGDMLFIKGLLSSPKCMVRRPYAKEATYVDTPQLIFCVDDDSWLKRGDRRFDLIKVLSKRHLKSTPVKPLGFYRAAS